VSGHLSPSTAQHVLADLEGSIDLVLDGGECPLGIESTVLDVVSSPPRILRPGAVPVQEIRRLLANVAVADADPERRYAPAARMVLVEACAGMTTLAEVVRAERRRGRRVALVATQEGAAAAPCEIVAMWREPPAGRVEREFFARLREAEQTGADVIVVQAPPETPKTSVLLHRLRSAATEFVGADGPSRLNEADCDYDDTSP
ncbi:MAG: L-threonylcarbamoyladenylate synthase, partial [Armatimonadota bacterium]